MEEKAIKAKMIDTGNGCFIFAKERCGYDSPLKHLYFDGEQPKESYKRDWYYIPNRPAKIQKKNPQRRINARWELVSPEMKGKLLETVPSNYSGDDCDLYFDGDGCFRLSRFYEYKYDLTPEEFEDVEIEWELIMDVDDFEQPPQICFEGIGCGGGNDLYKITNNSISHYALDEMLVPPVLIHNRPCHFTSKQVYDITRQYVKEHIDLRVAKITSDFDFCFEVKKLIPLYSPEKITYQNLFAKTKKEREKLHTSIVEYRSNTTVLEMTSEERKYKGYTPIPKMCANSEKELQEKMQKWLDYVISEINKPLVECPHCKGLGIIEQGTNKVVFDFLEEEK